MPRKRQPAPPSAIERDFLDALARLAAGKPTNIALKKLAAKGKLRITISSVAKEAGRARTLIAHENCRYPAVRQRVLEHMKPIANPRDGSAVIAKLREDIADLRLKLKNALAEQAAHFHARQKAERDAARWKRAYDRVLKKQASESQNGKVLPFPGSAESESEATQDVTSEHDLGDHR